MYCNNNDCAVAISGLSKSFRSFKSPLHRLGAGLLTISKGSFIESIVLSDIDLEIKRGESFGIIGRNGAGKSTLLKIICGVLQPSSGVVAVNGKVIGLLELGAGFNPELTGLENIELYSKIYGVENSLSQSLISSVVSFAAIGDYINQPVRVYSSGMFVRLAFAIMVHLEPDILVIDEALAVGDAFFQRRCYARLRQLKQDGVTVIFTSHDMSSLSSLCDRVLWLESGKVRQIGLVKEVSKAYEYEWIKEANQAALVDTTTDSTVSDGSQTIETTRLIEILGVHLVCQTNVGQTIRVHYGDTVSIVVRLKLNADLSNLVVSYHLKDLHNVNVCGQHTMDHLKGKDFIASDYQSFEIVFNLKCILKAGDYSVTVLAASFEDDKHFSDAIFHCWEDELASLIVERRSIFPLTDLVELDNRFSVYPQPVAILDDFFPNTLSGFRTAEFTEHLKIFRGLTVYTTTPNLSYHLKSFSKLFPEVVDKVQQYNSKVIAGLRLVYIVFLNNAIHFLESIEIFKVKFILTLYPGGGFGLGDLVSDEKLLRVLKSDCLEGIITTQKIVDEYVISFAQRNGLSAPKLIFIPGVVVPVKYLEYGAFSDCPHKRKFNLKLQVCFIAERYMPYALNKGFPVFKAAVNKFRHDEAIDFHLVGGGYTPEEVSSSRKNNKAIRYHGRIVDNTLYDFLHQMDIVLSLSVPDQLHAGNFDGFPTASCVQASLCGAAIVGIDSLRQNSGYVHGEDIWLIDDDVGDRVSAIESVLRMFMSDRDLLSTISSKGMEKSRYLYSFESQIVPRQRIIREALS